MACILWIVQAQTAHTLFGRPVAVELLIDPGHQLGAAHAAVMARHLSSFSGPVISSPGMTAGFGRIWRCPGAACWKWWCWRARAGGKCSATHPMAINASMPVPAAKLGWTQDMAGSFWLPGARRCQLDQNPALSF